MTDFPEKIYVCAFSGYINKSLEEIESCKLSKDMFDKNNKKKTICKLSGNYTGECKYTIYEKRREK